MPAPQRPWLPVALTLVIVLAVVRAPAASAHTALAATSPPAGARSDALDAITLRFDGPIDVAQLHVWLELDGAVAPLAGASTASDDGATVRVPLPPIAAGDHALGWHLIGSDGHAASGTVPFVLGATSPGHTAGPVRERAPATVDAVEPEPGRRASAAQVGALVALSAGLTIALARRATRGLVAPLAAAGIAASLGVAALGELLPVVEVAAWTASLAVVFAAAHPSVHRVKEHVT